MKPLTLSECIPSAHFLDKKEKRDVDWQDIRFVLEKPTVVEPCQDGRVRYVRGDFAIVVANHTTEQPVLITILLRETSQWTDEDVRKRRTR